jgi:hypothetical protein
MASASICTMGGAECLVVSIAATVDTVGVHQLPREPISPPYCHHPLLKGYLEPANKDNTTHVADDDANVPTVPREAQVRHLTSGELS